MTDTKATSEATEALTEQGNPSSAEPVALTKSTDEVKSGGRTAVGRATVRVDAKTPQSSGPAQPPSQSAPATQASTAAEQTSAPKFTRAAGMAPPPDAPTQPVLGPGAGATLGQATAVSAATTSAQSASGSHPVVGAAVARASVRPTGRIGATGASQTTGPIQVGAARVANAVRGVRAAVVAGPGRGPRRARLYIKRVDPWSVMKFSFAVSFVLLVVAVVATSVLYLALDAMGVFDSVNQALAAMFSSNGADVRSSFKITAKGVIFGSALLGTVNVVLFTALATLGAFIYNVCADMVGGIELTLAEKE
jgi:hypothetical protein